MSDFVVDDVKKGGLDSTGAAILAVYGKVRGTTDQGHSYGRYAVYLTDSQVMVQFSDTDEEGVAQRATLAPLYPTRSKINALISSLRGVNRSYTDRKADEYEGRLASALLIALQGDSAGAKAETERIIDDLSEDAASDVRTRHLIYASIATASIIVLARILSSSWFGDAFGRFDKTVSPNYWIAAGVGAIGALFSIALEIRERRIPVDLQPWDNIIDAVLRIFVGAVSATILQALLQSGLVLFQIGGARLGSDISGIVIAAFAGGFTQRLVADFLGGVTVGARRAEATPTPQVGRLPGAASDEMQVARAGAGGGSSTPGERSPEPTNPSGQSIRTIDSEAAEEPDEDEVGTSPIRGARHDAVARPVG